MTIHLPELLENSILAAVHRGRFTSVDAAMTEAASLLIERLKHEPPQTNLVATGQPAPDTPVLQRLFERAAAIPDEECDKLAPDLAEQHDHYLYGTPKRATA
jgi:hypothetical protein